MPLPPAGAWDPFEADVQAGRPVQVAAMYTADNRTTRASPDYEVHGTLPHVTRTFGLQLAPSEVAAGAWFELDGARVAAPLVHAYAGAVVGRPADMVRLTVTPTWVRGMVYEGDHPFDVALGAFPLPEYVAGGGAARAGHAHTHAQLAAPGAPHADPLQCLSDPLVGGERDPRSFKPTVRDGPSKDAPLRAHLVMDADDALVALLGNDTAAYLVSEAQELDLIFSHETAVTMRLDGVAVHTRPLGAAGGLFGNLKGAWDGRDLDRDLLVGFTANVEDIRGLGETGQAYCIGAAGAPAFAYAFVGVDPATFNERGMRYILGHEVEHLFNAEHHDANDVETDACTLMAVCAPVAGLNFVFSSIERGFVRGWAEAHLQNP
jgi:hypothetical protein